ncbi:hypothetical protein [Nocardia cyriacigeorgica]|uniref:hypothetical protein n=2 Tax=Nocardia cyriacigeorgica TaxID=135487 RepID=UPI0024587C44|nr:hypothetical protein [Nocardia cyriacigeorgica]
MGEVMNHLRRLLGVVANFFDKVSPWGMPWPLAFALVFPFVMGVLAVVVWWSRGTAKPVRCDYPITTTGHPCRNRVLGEWKRCHHHRPGRERSRGRVVQKLYRWQTMRRGQRVERDDIRGRGFLRDRSQVRGLLYYRGFARPPGNAVGSAGTWWNERRDDLRKLRDQLRDTGSFDIWTAFAGAAGRSARIGVSDQVLQVIWATRTVAVLVATGLVLVGISVWRNHDPASWHSYAATFTFVLAWSVVRWGIWETATGQAPVHRSWDWVRTSIRQATKLFFWFVVLSVAAAEQIGKLEKLMQGPGAIQLGF